MVEQILIPQQEIRKECIPVEDFLKTHTAYDLLPESGKLVVIDVGVTISSALQSFLENNIQSAPLYDSRRHEYVGMLTLLDFIDILIDFYSYIPPEDFTLCLEIVTLREWRRSKRAQRMTLKESTKNAHEVHSEGSLFTFIIVVNTCRCSGTFDICSSRSITF
jgi:hypothetical protein